MSKVLVVENEKNVLATLSIGLRRYDYEVIQAKSGTEALRIMKEAPCEIVISDVCMSPMDGHMLASRIHALYPGVRVVLISAYGIEEKSNEQENDYEYVRLTKPLSVFDLIQILKQRKEKENN